MRRVRMKWRESFNLIAEIRACIYQEPIGLVCRDGKLSLAPRRASKPPVTQPPAIQTGAIPLRKSSPGGRTKNSDVRYGSRSLRLRSSRSRS